MSHTTKDMQKPLFVYLILVSCLISLTRSAPTPEVDISDAHFDDLSHQNIDYNTVLSHFKEFFMYLPVIFTTFKETMSGFPQLAEGIKTLTAPYDKSPDGQDEDCKCVSVSTPNSNQIDKSSKHYATSS